MRGKPEVESQLAITGQCAFPAPTRPGLWSSGWIVAHPEITQE
jgi:hypothetical protein